MQGEIRRENEQTILGTNPEDLAEYYYDKYRLPEIEIIRGPELEIVEDVVDIPAHQRDEWYQNEGPLRNFPIKRGVINTWLNDFPDIRRFWPLRTSRFSLSYRLNDYIINSNRIGIGFDVKAYNLELNDDQVAQRVNSEVARLQKEIEWKNTDIRNGNAELKQTAVNEINTRREHLQKNDALLDGLSKKISIPLIKHASTEPIRPRVEIKRPIKKMKPTPKIIEQYTLDKERIQDILQFIDEYMKSLERTAGSLVSLGEEQLRDLILAHLNGVFEGRATGETFSKNGKTDIYLNIDKGNILVAECKIWGGKELLNKTVDQIRGYLTWRHNYGIVINFSRNKDFTRARNSLGESIPEIDSYVSDYRQIGDTHFVASHCLEDEQKLVEVHYLIYNLYYGGDTK